MENFIKDIIVSVGYDDVEKPNLIQYEYEPNWLPRDDTNPKRYQYWLKMENFFGNQYHTFNVNTIQHFKNTNENFIYPIVLYSNSLFSRYQTIDFGDDLLERIKNKKAKIVFLYITEGWFGETKYHYDWFENLALKHSLEKEDIVIITANLSAEKNYEGNKFTIITYNYFVDELNFANIKKRDDLCIKLFKNKYLKFIDNFKIKNHFLCFNNLTKLHRLWIFYELMNNPKLKNKSILSLNKSTIDKSFFEVVNRLTNYQEMIEYYKTYNSNIGYSYDTTNWEKDVSAGDTININAHLNTFVNIVTETLYHNDVIFLTEKTYKAIYSCQPFIIVGNSLTLKKLKELGFKTFDKWWDESYDDEMDFEKRMYKITKLLEEIASWDFEKCTLIRKEMREILIHNYNQMLDTTEMQTFYSKIQTDTKKIEKSKLL